MPLEQLQERKTKLEAQRVQYIEDAKRQIAAFDGALSLLAEMITEMETAADE
jgi:hypothetical protein